MLKLTRVNSIKHLLDQKTLIYLINAFVFSRLVYCSMIWSSAKKKNVRKLQLVQNYACRIVAGLLSSLFFNSLFYHGNVNSFLVYYIF